MIPRYSIDYNIQDLIHTLRKLTASENNSFQSDFRNQKIFYTGSGSSALRIILRNINLHKGDKIAIPLLTCERVIKSILSEGFVPTFVDISENELLSLPRNYQQAVENDHVSAIIAISMWGYPVDIASFAQSIDPSIPIIHDCALSPGSQLNSKEDGQNSKLAFFSYGIGKPVCLGFGGKAQLTGIPNIYDNEFLTEKNTTIIYHSVRSFIKSFLFAKEIYWLPYFLGKIVKSKDEHPFEMENITLIPQKSLFSIELQNQKLNTRIIQARSNIIPIKRMFDELGFTTIKEDQNTEWNHWMFPVLAPRGIDASIIQRKLVAHGFEIGLPYRRTVQLARKYWGYKNTCKNIEANLSRIFTIPSPHQFSEKSLQRFINVFSSLFGETYVDI